MIAVRTTSVCKTAFSLEGGTISSAGYPGGGCTGTEGELPEGYSSEGEIIWTYRTEGELARLTPNGAVVVTGGGTTCRISYPGSMTK